MSGGNSPRAVWADDNRSEDREAFRRIRELEGFEEQFGPSFFSNTGEEEDCQVYPYSTENPSEFASASQALANAHAPAPSDLPVRASLCTTLNAATESVSISDVKFAASRPHRISETANWLVAYGVPTIEDFSATDEIDRRYFPEDLRETKKLTFPQLALLFKLPRHIPPLGQKVSEKNMRFDEIDIPKALASYSPPIASISAFFPLSMTKYTGRRRKWPSQLQRTRRSFLIYHQSFMSIPGCPRTVTTFLRAKNGWDF